MVLKLGHLTDEKETGGKRWRKKYILYEKKEKPQRSLQRSSRKMKTSQNHTQKASKVPWACHEKINWITWENL